MLRYVIPLCFLPFSLQAGCEKKAVSCPLESLRTFHNHSSFYIFVSFSMGEKALLNLAHEAKEVGATLVLRGFKAGSLRQTVASLARIIQKTEEGILIDPELFERFHVKTVPTYVLSSPQSKLSDQMQGHVSLRHGLEAFAKEGDLKEEALALLKGRRS